MHVAPASAAPASIAFRRSSPRDPPTAPSSSVPKPTSRGSIPVTPAPSPPPASSATSSKDWSSTTRAPSISIPSRHRGPIPGKRRYLRGRSDLHLQTAPGRQIPRRLRLQRRSRHDVLPPALRSRVRVLRRHQYVGLLPRRYDHRRSRRRITVRSPSAAPNAAFIELSNIYAGRILSPKAIQEVPNPRWAEGSYGTGPFSSRVLGEGRQSRALERNENYWGTKPGLQTLIFRPIPEPTARVAALLNGEVDMIVVVPPDSIESIKANTDLTYEQGPSLHYWFIQLNTTAQTLRRRPRPPGRQLRGRQGGSRQRHPRRFRRPRHPTDARRQLVLQPRHLGYPYDPEKAKPLLAEAGLADGFRPR